MEQGYIRIKCPACGAILSIQNQPGIDDKHATCTVCKTRNLIRDYIKVAARQEEQTKYPGHEENTKYGSSSADPSTQLSMGTNLIIGRLIVLPDGPIYQLKLGRQVVGRKAINPPHADFGIPTESKRMSREHLIVEVKKIQGKGFMHYASLFKEQVNATSINNHPLEFGDCIVLQHGDIIHLPDKDIRFEMPDDERTIY